MEELEAELRAANQRIDTANELARYVEEEKELQQEQREWERRRRRAGLLTRAKWAVFGTSEPVESEG